MRREVRGQTCGCCGASPEVGRLWGEKRDEVQDGGREAELGFAEVAVVQQKEGELEEVELSRALPYMGIK